MFTCHRGLSHRRGIRPGTGYLLPEHYLESFWKILVDSAKMSGMIVFLIGVSEHPGVMAFTQIPRPSARRFWA